MAVYATGEELLCAMPDPIICVWISMIAMIAWAFFQWEQRGNR